jgi:hypothetical protein
MIPKTSPWRISKLTRFKAFNPPKLMERFSVSKKDI